MKKTFQYRTIETTWGVAIDLIAHIEENSLDDSTPSVRFQDNSLEVCFRPFAELGLTKILDAYPQQAHSLFGKIVVIENIQYTPTDFHEEGITCAVAEWLCKELSIERCPIQLKFDPSRNRYVISESTEE